MKYIWEIEDIKAGVSARHFGGAVYTVATADTAENIDVGYVLYRADTHRITPTYSAEKIVELFNSQECIPING